MATDKSPEARQRRLEQVITMLRAANAAGRKLMVKEVMEALQVSKPTASGLLDDARQAIAEASVVVPVVMATPMPEVTAPAPGAALAMAQALGVGVDLLGELEQTLKHLTTLRDTAMADLEVVRFVVFGDRGSRPMPAMCASCRKEKAEDFTKVRPSLALLSLEAKDAPKFYAEAVRVLKGVTDTLDTYNGVMEQFYNFVALEKTSRRYAQAIKNVCPEYSRAIAQEFRRLSAQGD